MTNMIQVCSNIRGSQGFIVNPLHHAMLPVLIGAARPAAEGGGFLLFEIEQVTACCYGRGPF